MTFLTASSRVLRAAASGPPLAAKNQTAVERADMSPLCIGLALRAPPGRSTRPPAQPEHDTYSLSRASSRGQGEVKDNPVMIS
jgi:hypothetical protein